jgi:hypothetical protein
MLLAVLFSPFSVLLLVLLLFGRGAVFEYSVMARNYGISVLLLFTLAIVYERYRARGITLGLVLFLLANCNAHSVLLAGAFLLFWALDLAFDPASRTAARMRTWLLNAAIATAGMALAAFTILPAKNDAVLIETHGTLAARLLQGMLLPATSFFELFDVFPAAATVLFSIVMFASLLGLARRPAALLAAGAALLGFSLFFQVIYPGSYRHEGLWLAFLVTLYWIAGREAAPAAVRRQPVLAIGRACLLILLAVQVPAGLLRIGLELASGRPESRARDLALLLAARPELRQATVLADPDFMLEPLPYYMPNPTYLLREQRYGRYAVFKRQARLRLDLCDILADARAIRAASGQPVVILLQQRLDSAAPARDVAEGYNWQLALIPSQVRVFQATTQRIARFPPALTDESYDVYVLGDPAISGTDEAISCR